MSNQLAALSKPINQVKIVQDLKTILDCTNQVISKKIEETYPLSSLKDQPFVLWYSNEFVFQGSFDVNNLPGAEKYQAYDYVDSTEIERFLTSRDRPLPDIITGSYFMYVTVNDTTDIHSKDANFISTLFVKTPFELI